MNSTTATRRATPAVSGRDLAQRVRKALAATGYPELERLRVEDHEGLVFLHGHVTTYYQKQIAQTVAMQVDGVGKLKNDVMVR